MSAEDPYPATTRTPAQWIEGKDEFTSHLSCPAYGSEKDGVVAIYCQAEIDIRGETTSSLCFSKPVDSNHRHLRATRRAYRKVNYSPATINGEPVEVLAYASAYFVTKGGNCTAFGFPNWGLSANALGSTDYISPQEISHDGGWVGKTQSMMRAARPRFLNRAGTAFSFSADISNGGAASNVRIVSNPIGLSEDELEQVVGAYSDSSFIPGHLDGEPQAMPILEVFYLPPPAR